MTFKQLIKSLNISIQVWQECLDNEVDLVWEGLMNYDEINWEDLRQASSNSEELCKVQETILNQEW